MKSKYVFISFTIFNLFIYIFSFRCEKSIKKEDISIFELINIFQDLKTNYADEFIIFNLSQLSIPLLTPVLKRKMDLWDPFEIYENENNENEEFYDLNYCHSIYSNLKDLLKDATLTDKKSHINPFHRIIWDTWMPSFRKNILEINLKNKEHCLKCVDLINNWHKLLPGWIIENIFEQIIMPKLIQQVEDWNPVVDTVPIHAWVHPWLPLIKERLEIALFPQIRFKLSNALAHWHPSDISAKAILMPWKPPVFSSSSWDNFMLRNILPKLECVLKEEFKINPSDQNLEAWNWIMEWRDLIPLANFISLLEESFFPVWLKVLCEWLNSKPNYEEVTNWYSEWKSLLTEKLSQHPNIKAKLGQGLMMMSRSSSGAKVFYNVEEKKPIEVKAPVDSDTLKVNFLNFYILSESELIRHFYYKGKRFTNISNYNNYNFQRFYRKNSS